MSNNGGHNTIQYNLRWSEEMRDKIAAAAKKNTRSMNQEIIARLEQSLVMPLEFKPDDKEMITQIVALSMQTLIEKLHDEGVEDEKLSSAVSKLANKKAP